MMELFSSLLIGFTILLMVFGNLRNRKKLPPAISFKDGNWPIVGCHYSLGPYAFKTFMKWSKTYGPVFRLRLGSTEAYVLNGWAAIKEALVDNDDAFSDRPHSIATDLFLMKYGISMNSGSEWKEQKRFFIRQMRDFGFGKKSFESVIMFHCEELIRDIASLKGQPFKSMHMLEQHIFNITWSIGAGSSNLNTFDKESLKKFNALHKECETCSGTESLISFPWLRYVAPDYCGYNILYRGMRQRRALLKTIIQKHLDNLDPTCAKDFTDSYLIKMNELSAKNEATTLNINNLIGTLNNLFIASLETTGKTLSWCLLLIVSNPSIQEKLLKEVDEVLGEQLPSYETALKLVYLQAVLFETARYSTIGPLALHHMTTRDTWLSGANCLIPAGSDIIPNLYSVHHEQEYWVKPDEFNPGRFIDQNNKLRKDEHLIPFSIGKRVCPGLYFAETEMVLILASLMQKFTFHLENNAELPDLNSPVNGLTVSPPAHNLIALIRFK